MRICSLITAALLGLIATPALACERCGHASDSEYHRRYWEGYNSYRREVDRDYTYERVTYHEHVTETYEAPVTRHYYPGDSPCVHHPRPRKVVIYIYP